LANNVKIATVISKNVNYDDEALENETLTQLLKSLDINDMPDSVVFGDETYFLSKISKIEYAVYSQSPFGAASMNSYLNIAKNPADFSVTPDTIIAVENAIVSGNNSVIIGDSEYRLASEDRLTGPDGADVLLISDLIFGAEMPDTVLSGAFYEAAIAAIRAKDASFSCIESEPVLADPDTTDTTQADVVYELDENGEIVYHDDENTYYIKYSNENIYISSNQETLLISIHSDPDAKHILGTDSNGMDVFVRLMYGGRISLMIGFIVVIIETVLGMILGGVSGYFGKWIDNVIMRFVDLVNSIPTFPMYIIVGSLLDTVHMGSMPRLFVLMGLLGILSWTGIARIVRGQILTLREQDFIVATEATGLRVSRRIFRHLIPNVMPLLIVQATMGLGGVILTESTLSFLGLGVKYPTASWGSIITQVNDSYVMTHCWYIWIPAGILILLTVLGFNFVGDGLRDAFDPKMKR